MLLPEPVSSTAVSNDSDLQVPGPSVTAADIATDISQDILRAESPIHYITNPAYSRNADYNRFAADVAVRRMIQRRHNTTATVDHNNAPPLENPLFFYVSLGGWRNTSPEARALATRLCEDYGTLCDINSNTDNNGVVTFFAGFASVEESISCITFFPRRVAGRDIIVRIADTSFLPATFLP